jgi:hypothetical protein
MASRYLYNSIDANCGVQSPIYVVDNAPVRITVTGLLAGQSIPVLFRMSGDCLGPNGSPCARHLSYTTPVARGGCATALSDLLTQIIEVMPGTYELDMSAIPANQPVAVLMEELSDLTDRSSVGFVLPYAQCAPVPAPVACPPVAPLGLIATWG